MARSVNSKQRAPGDQPAVPGSLQELLGVFRGCFSAWTFPVFCALACGMVAQSARRTVCGMLVGAGLSQTWSHHRAHRFFSHASWSIEQVSAVAARLVVRLLVAEGAPITVAIDDTLFSRRGPKVHAASWFHDGSAVGKTKIGYGNNWVILAIVVSLGSSTDRSRCRSASPSSRRTPSTPHGSPLPAGSSRRSQRRFLVGRSTSSPTPPTRERRFAACRDL